MKTLMAAIMAAATIIPGGAAIAAGSRAPQPGSWEYRVALETGSLPATAAVTARTDGDGADAAEPAVEAGGVLYRIGIDTN